jgi:hypothetical protein
MNPLRRNLATHIRHEIQSFVNREDEELTLAGFWEKLDYSTEDFRDHHLCPKGYFGDYMNEISKNIFKSLPDLGAYLLKSLVVLAKVIHSRPRSPYSLP